MKTWIMPLARIMPIAAGVMLLLFGHKP